MSASTHRQILRSTSIIGGASAINIFVGLIRMKVAALILGPIGVGLVGICHNLIQAASTLTSVGMGSAGTRQLAETVDDEGAQSIARRALLIAGVVLSLIGGLLLLLLRAPTAELILGDGRSAGLVGWLALGVALSVGITAQNALLTGMRRIGDLARVSIGSALLGTVLGVGALLIWRERGLLAFVLLSPAATFLVGLWFVRRLPRPTGPVPAWRAMVPQWKTLARLGFAFTVGSLVGTGGQLAVRSLVQRELGGEALGQFQASWTISLNYIGFILTAMAADYYPRLTAAMRDRSEAVRTVNHQAEVALLLAGPVLVGTVALAPWIVQVLYSSKFLPAAELLRWQIAGDLLKIASWPLGFILLAGGQGRAYMLTEAMGAAVLAGGTALALPAFGLLAPGVGYVAMYLAYLPVTFVLARRLIGFAPSAGAIEVFSLVATAIFGTVALTYVAPLYGSALGVTAAAALTWLAAVRLQHALPEPIAALVRRIPGVGR